MSLTKKNPLQVWRKPAHFTHNLNFFFSGMEICVTKIMIGTIHESYLQLQYLSKNSKLAFYPAVLQTAKVYFTLY